CTGENAICGRGDLLSFGLGVLRKEGALGGETGNCDRAGNGNLAEFFARNEPGRDSGGFCQRKDIGTELCPLSEVAGASWILFAAILAECTGICIGISDAE